MERRAFLLAALPIAVAVMICPAAHAQSPKRIPVIGFLGTSSPTTTPASARLLETFDQGLRRTSWIDGQTVRIVKRFSEGRSERFPELARELVQLKVDVLVTAGSPATQAAKEASGTVPIVFVAVSHPVEAGFAASLARPGGNVTGVTNQLSDLEGKVLQLAREATSHLRHVGIMWNPTDPGSALGFDAAQRHYTSLDIKVTSAPVRSLEDFDGALDVLARDLPDFLIVHPSPTIFRHRERIGQFALRTRLPTITNNRAMVEDGSILMGYGPDFADLFRRAAAYVDRILRGAQPANLPIEQPTRFELVINLKTAKALGLTIPPSLLQRADQVIE